MGRCGANESRDRSSLVSIIALNISLRNLPCSCSVSTESCVPNCLYYLATRIFVWFGTRIDFLVAASITTIVTAGGRLVGGLVLPPRRPEFFNFIFVTCLYMNIPTFSQSAIFLRGRAIFFGRLSILFSCVYLEKPLLVLSTYSRLFLLFSVL